MGLPRRDLLVALTTLAIAGCAGLGGPRTITLATGDIEGWMARAFPVDRRLLEVFDVTLSEPRLSLDSARKRIGLALEIGSRDRLLGGSWRGRLSFDAELRWDRSDNSLRLQQVRVQDFTLGGAGTTVRSGAERLGGALVERVLEGMSVYRLTPEAAARLQREGLQPVAATVGWRGVEIELQPIAH